MKKSKIVAILICMTLLLGITAACGGGGDTTSPSGNGAASPSGGGDASPSSGGAASPSGGGAASPSGGGAASPNGGDVASPTSSSSGSGRDTLVFTASADPGTLSPILFGGDYSTAVGLIIESLWTILQDGSIYWKLATGVDEITPTHWIVHLREGVTFSNGDPFTADDVLFSIKLHKEYSTTAGPRVQTIDENATSVIDDYTLDLVMSEYHCANYLVFSACAIYNEESYSTEQASNNPIGTGPYVLDEYIINSHLKLKRNENYWGEKPAIPYMMWRVLAEPAQVVNALELHQVDYAAIQAADYDFVSSLPGFNIIDKYMGNYGTLAFSMGQYSVFKDNLDARQAVCHAIDTQAIINIVYEGRAIPMTCNSTHVVSDYGPRFENQHDIYTIGYDPALAKQLAESSGLVGQTVRIAINPLPAISATAEMVQNMLLSIGVNAEINTYDAATMWSLRYDPDAQYDMTLGTGFVANMLMADSIVNGVQFSPVMSAPGAWPGVERFMEICNLAFSETDPQKREDIMYEVLKLHTDAILGLALCDISNGYAWADYVDQDSIVYNRSGGLVPNFIQFLP